jgi:RHS repeat-associated protein
LGRRTARADSGTVFAAQPTYGDPATVEMPAYNAYAYNPRSEVTGAARRWGTPEASGDLVLGQQYAYEFDPIGNRITAAEGNTNRTATYTANELNQYTQRTVPGEKDLIGTAPTNVAVTVNQNPASRQSAYWHHALEVTNAASAAYPQVAITAVYNPPGTNDPDVVTSQTGRVYMAQTPEQFQYDDDGNLTQDGRFTYTWDGENRLIGVTSRDDLPASVPRVKVDYLYDHQSRRIASAFAVWTNDAWQAAECRAFIYDGWNVVQESINHQPSTTNYYVWGLDLSGSLQGAGGIGGLLAGTFGGTTSVSSAFYCHDANGNVGQLVDADGALLAHYEYSSFGETVVSTGPLAKANPFRFSTKHWDDVIGLGYWGYRYYHPDMGRWLSRDPMGDESFLRRLEEGRPRQEKRRLRSRSQQPAYLFVRNCPICTYDILGLDDPGCNLPDRINPGRGNRGDADCYRRCCAQHDACYFRNGCTKASWGLNIGGIAADIAGCKFCSILIEVVSPCTRCNSSVVACFARCCTGINPPTGKQWFCPNGERKGEWFDDWEKIPADCWKNGQKPENP